MKLGHINYLNMLPLYHKLLAGDLPQGVSLVSDLPSSLNKAMAAGELDISPVSATSYAHMQDSVCLLPEFCLAADGPVSSVLLASHRPIEQLTGCKIGLSGASHTSVVLLKILLEQCFELTPEYVASPPAPDFYGLDAALVIGDDALRLDRGTVRHVYDLGELWKQATGMPMVYAVFAVNRNTADRYRQSLADVLDAFDATHSWAQTQHRELALAAADFCPHITCNFEQYFGHLIYRFSPQLREALLDFFSRATAVGLLPEVSSLAFLPTPRETPNREAIPACAGAVA